MKHIKTFKSFVNEGSLPFDIEKTLRLDGVTFEFDKELTDNDSDNRLDFVQVYVGADKRTSSEWLIKAGVGGGFFYLEIQKNEKVLYSDKYPKSQKANFDQDCMSSLGFLPELD